MISSIKRIVKSVGLNVLNYGIGILDKKPVYFIPNLYGTVKEKKVLISYITHPFTLGKSDAHTNYIECATACEIFDEIGYIVDVVNFDFIKDGIDYNDYDVIYGFGQSFEDSFNLVENISLKRILYGAGCDSIFQNRNTLSRVNDFYKKTGLLCLNSARIADYSWRRQIAFSDLIISLGNEFVCETYRAQSFSQVVPIDIFYRNTVDVNLHEKNYDTAKNKFLWWGSLGAIHKGLDILLDVFSSRTDIELFICGYYPEYPFDKYLKSILDKCQNIHVLEFIRVGSEEYLELIKNCVAVVFPTASEGGAPGVIQLAASAGIIPIVSKNAGVNILYENLEIIEFNSKSIQSCIEVILNSSEEQLREMSINVRKFYSKNGTVENYKATLKHYISKAVSG